MESGQQIRPVIKKPPSLACQTEYAYSLKEFTLIAFVQIVSPFASVLNKKTLYNGGSVSVKSAVPPIIKPPSLVCLIEAAPTPKNPLYFFVQRVSPVAFVFINKIFSRLSAWSNIPATMAYPPSEVAATSLPQLQEDPGPSEEPSYLFVQTVSPLLSVLISAI